MNECEKYLVMIEQYVDDALGDEERTELLTHVEECRSCRAELEAHKKLVDSIEALDLFDPGEKFTAAVMERIFAPAEGKVGLLERLTGRLREFGLRHKRLAWSPLLVVFLLVSLSIPFLLETGAVKVLGTGSRVLSFLVNPLAGLLTSLDRAVDIAGPLLRTFYITMKVIADLVLTLAGTAQLSFIMIASVLIVLTAGLCFLFRYKLAKRRIYNAVFSL